MQAILQDSWNFCYHVWASFDRTREVLISYWICVYPKIYNYNININTSIYTYVCMYISTDIAVSFYEGDIQNIPDWCRQLYSSCGSAKHMASESVCQVARSWVDVDSFHTSLFGVVYFAIASVREFLETPSYLIFVRKPPIPKYRPIKVPHARLEHFDSSQSHRTPFFIGRHVRISHSTKNKKINWIIFHIFSKQPCVIS
jgi:hypothetical protein